MKGVIILFVSIAIGLFSALFTFPIPTYITNATIRDIIGWLYAGSTALLASFIFLVATLESQEKVRLKRGFYMIYSGVFVLTIVHLVTTLLVVFYSARLIEPLTIIQICTVASALYVVSVVLAFLTVFIFPKRRDNAMWRFLRNKIEYYYAVYEHLSEKKQTRQRCIHAILSTYGIGYDSDLNRDPHYISIPSGTSGYIALKKKHLRQIGRKVRKILRHSSASRQKDEKMRAYHCIICDERIATETPLLFISRTAGDAKTIQQQLSRLLARKVKCSKIPKFTKTTYIDTMQSFQEVLLQEKSIDVFRDYAEILQELLFRYLENEYIVEERDRDATSAQDPFRIPKPDHSILAWYHRIADALVRSKKAEGAEWIEELLALYRNPVYYLYNWIELPKKLLYDFLDKLEGLYYQAGAP